jgi:hypothetical protein
VRAGKSVWLWIPTPLTTSIDSPATPPPSLTYWYVVLLTARFEYIYLTSPSSARFEGVLHMRFICMFFFVVVPVGGR